MTRKTRNTRTPEHESQNTKISTNPRIKKTPNYESESEDIKLPDTTIVVVCNMCKGTVVFIQGQDSKLCPGCGSLVQNFK